MSIKWGYIYIDLHICISFVCLCQWTDECWTGVVIAALSLSKTNNQQNICETNGSHQKVTNIYLVLSTRQSSLSSPSTSIVGVMHCWHFFPIMSLRNVWGELQNKTFCFNGYWLVSPSNCKPMTEVPSIRTDKVDKYTSLFLWGTDHIIVFLLSTIALSRSQEMQTVAATKHNWQVLQPWWVITAFHRVLSDPQNHLNRLL